MRRTIMNFGTKAFQQFAPRIIAMTHSPIKLSLLVSLLPCKPKNRCFFLDHISKSCVIVRKNVIANEVIIPVAGIYKICGCRNTTYAKIILMTDLILVAVSSLLAFSLRNVIVLGEGNDSMTSFLISVGFIIFICISPIILTVISARRLSFSELLYFGD